MKMMLKLVFLLSSTAVTLAAPGVMEIPAKTTSSIGDLADVKEESNDNKELASIIKDDDQKKLNPDESPVLKEILDKLDKSDIAKAIDEEMVSKTKSSLDGMMVSEITKSDDTAQKLTKNEAEDSTYKLENTMIKTSDNVGSYITKINEETDKQLKDVASAVAEVVTSLPPVPNSTPNKYTEVIGHFISDLLQIPMVLLHAVSNAIATLTNNKVNIPTPSFLSQSAQLVNHPH